MKTTKQRLYLHGRPDTKAHFVLDEDDIPLCGKRIFLGEDSRVARIWSNKYGNLEFTLSHDDLPYELRLHCGIYGTMTKRVAIMKNKLGGLLPK